MAAHRTSTATPFPPLPVPPKATVRAGTGGLNMARLLAVSAAVAAALVLAPTAHADTGGGDTQFLEIFHDHIYGVTATNGDTTLIGLGHSICKSLAENLGDRGEAQ